ncbi:MAG: Rrf2 family transcriptional regulator [Bacteroidetes bacterium]|nr:MAG: Rrf2 family transcriptional regulator [Bacteroidota bacterium]
MSSVFNLSEASSIAIHSMVMVASSEGKTNVNEIAKRLNFSKHHVAKVMQRLVKVDILKSNRGPSGGFSLAKPASEISLLDIYEAIEGRMVSYDCPLGYEECAFEKCILGSIAHDMNKNFKNYLDSHNLQFYVDNGYMVAK